MTISGTQVVAVEIVGDMTLMASDSRNRDTHLGREGLEYKTFPTSSFVLTEPLDVSVIPPEGEAVAFDGVGELTVRDVTRVETIAMESTMVGDQIVVIGSLFIQTDDYGASIDNIHEATMEFSVVFNRE